MVVDSNQTRMFSSLYCTLYDILSSSLTTFKKYLVALTSIPYPQRTMLCRACRYKSDLHVVGPSAAACTVSSSSSRQPEANTHARTARGARQAALHRTRQPSHVYYNFTTTCLLQEVLFTRDEGAPAALTTRTQLALARACAS